MIRDLRIVVFSFFLSSPRAHAVPRHRPWKFSIGVYFGWASLETAGSAADSTSAASPPWKCVANVGYSPTFVGKENAEKIVEGHLIGYEGASFSPISFAVARRGGGTRKFKLQKNAG